MRPLALAPPRTVLAAAPRTPSEKETHTLGLIDMILGLVGFDLAASVEPIVGETTPGGSTRAKQCDKEKKTEVAKAEEKDGSEGGGSSKGKSRTGEPVYLAF